jgi:hypothetical protein
MLEGVVEKDVSDHIGATFGGVEEMTANEVEFVFRFR